CAEQAPLPKRLLEVTAVRVLRRGQEKPDASGLPVLAELAPPNNTITVTIEQRPEIVQVEFDPSIAYDPPPAILGKSFVSRPRPRRPRQAARGPPAEQTRQADHERAGERRPRVEAARLPRR